MPKHVLILMFAVTLGLAVSACNNSGSTPSTPTPGPSVTLSPNPKISVATIEVTVLGTPKANIPVAESTPKNVNSPRPGTTIVTQFTNAKGLTKFRGLDPKATYCWVATIGKNRTSGACGNWELWQTTVPIIIGT